MHRFVPLAAFSVLIGTGTATAQSFKLAPAVAQGKVLLAVLLLRLAWTLAEVGMVVLFWFLDARTWLSARVEGAPAVAEVSTSRSPLNHPPESCSPS